MMIKKHTDKSTLIMLLAAVITVLPCAKASFIKGSIKYTQWKEFNAALWTFHVHPKTEIFEPDSEVFTPFNESVSAIAMQHQKKIQALPVRLATKLPNLKVYEAHNCSVIEVSKENFENLAQLRAIDLQYNDLIAMPEDTFEDQTSLVYLDLAHNKILRIFEHTFRNLRALRMLYLGWNQIEILPKNLFRNLANLRKVGLTSNQIRRISNEHFEANTKLAFVWLNENKIEVIDDERVFHACRDSLKSVDLELNRCLNRVYSATELDSLTRDIRRNCRRR